ncbi:alpha/beta hydrolase [Xanthomarina gelatinilytica]|uniref:alpha/beta hydrolase n=1 Tax=Xanthomarina gelatinilytica TaxID=1137281 RepID=UPI003AA89EE9
MRLSSNIILVLTLLIYTHVSCQNKNKKSVEPYSLQNTEQRFLKSKSNDIDYKLYISLPESYNDSTLQKYPVLYLLDADYSFAIAKNIIDHLAQRNHLQEIIIVGIAYAGENKYRINRTRDYTPTNSEEPGVSFQEIQNKYSGGGLKFSKFIEDELISYIDSEYRTTDFRVLTGHSYGGLFSSWTLLTKPNLFNGYIVVSPSLWYDDKLMFSIEDKFSENDQKTKAYFTVGDREVNNQWNMPEDIKQFVEKLRSKKLDNLDIKFEIGENETHNSIFPSALSNGLRFIFDGT